MVLFGSSMSGNSPPNKATAEPASQALPSEPCKAMLKPRPKVAATAACVLPLIFAFLCPVAFVSFHPEIRPLFYPMLRFLRLSLFNLTVSITFLYNGNTLIKTTQT
jgi:hypothetical protein